ncbi:hypothetical protein [Rhizobacter fulvus]
MATTREITHIKVDIVINTKNRKRRIVFGLEKTTETDSVEWMIHFKLYERDDPKVDYSDNDLLVSLDVEVDAALNAKAEKAATLGFTPAQSAHAEGPAATDALAAKNGEIDEADAAETIQKTLKKK